MSSGMLLVVYCSCIILGSLAGGWVPLVFRLTHTGVQLAMSFVGGAMLGVGLLHLLPHACLELGAVDPAVAWLLAGFLAMFFVERVFQFHHHDAPHAARPQHDPHDPRHHEPAPLEHRHHDHVPHTHSASGLGWPAALIGLTLHSMLDGAALAASVTAESQEAGAAWAGLAVFLVVLLHKPFDAMALGTLLAVAGRPHGLRHLVNGVFALSIPAGVLLFEGVEDMLTGDRHQLVGAALAFAAGMFVCIATSDLLPELQFHSHDRLKLSAALLLGIALSAALVLVERAQHEQHSYAAPHEPPPALGPAP